MKLDEITCPKCGQRQPKRTLCLACAVDMPRIFAALAEEKQEEIIKGVSERSFPAKRIVKQQNMPDMEPVPAQPELPETLPISFAHVILVALFAAICAAFILVSGWVPILDSANLALHEAGHPLIGLLSRRLEVYGGTIFQLAFPLAIVHHFHRRSHATGAAVGLVWLGESLHNVARYMADARAQELPLVGGGDHDWTEIFSRWAVLHLDTRIANLTHVVGWLLMVGALVWLFRGVTAVANRPRPRVEGDRSFQ